MFYTIQNHDAPQYISRLIPPKVQSLSPYPLRNGDDIILPYCRLSLTNQSFIPDTIRQWNRIDPNIRNVNSISAFKNTLRKDTVLREVPRHYAYGPRKLNIILTQIRCSASFLNYDLFRSNLISNPSCLCGSRIEDANHFFFECPIYNNHRLDLIGSLRWLPNGTNIDLHMLTCGNLELSYEQNISIFREVFEYVKRSKRFLIV